MGKKKKMKEPTKDELRAELTAMSDRVDELKGMCVKSAELAMQALSQRDEVQDRFDNFLKNLALTDYTGVLQLKNQETGELVILHVERYYLATDISGGDDG